MINIEVDQEWLEELVRNEVRLILAETEEKQTFWDSDDLKKHVRMSWNTIQETFFHEPGFPKAKVGGKWLYPAKETEQFLLEWLKNQTADNF